MSNAPAPEIDAAIDLVVSAHAHCACAAGQALPTDDQIIIGHIQQAEAELREVMMTLLNIKNGVMA